MAFIGKPVRIGSDIGGTFTDIALEVGDELFSTKILTNYAMPEQGVLDGMERVIAKSGINCADIDLFIHGTTLATNALIERRGARTAFLTTKGFRDTIEMRTESRFEQYDLNIVLPRPLIEREDRYVADGRVSALGQELRPLDENAVEAFADRVVANGYESVAIGFLHSYLNPRHEQRARAIVAKRASHVSISISSDVSPQMRELERFNTVCANAFVKPLVSSYLARLVTRAKALGVTAPLFLIHSGGGLMSAETAMELPVRLLESGPAGGAIFAADVAFRHGQEKVLSFDMGGTTAKICLVDNYAPQTARSFEVARTTRFKKGSGMQISIPVVQMIEIGAGGGSIAHIDDMRQIRVGPESAGSEPGPACYQRGGEHPTVTDADFILGRLDGDNFAGGDITLSAAASKTALDIHIAQHLGEDASQAAVGVCEIVDENMTNAARVHAVESGRELSSFSMIAFGGAAPIHACRLCEKLEISELLVPVGAGVGSAIGFLRAPFGYEAVRGTYHALNAFDFDHANQILSELRTEAETVVRKGRQTGSLTVEAKAFMRYQGQGWEIPVPLKQIQFKEGDAELVASAFRAEYETLFGRTLDGVTIEVISWSVVVASPKAKKSKIVRQMGTQAIDAEGHRDIYDAKLSAFVSAAIVARKDMTAGDFVHGPAIIVENETTTIVTSSFDAIMQADGCLLLKQKG
jgi:N-methylhydantoinase A